MPKNKNAYLRYRIIDSMLRGTETVKTSAIKDKLYERHDISVADNTINKDIRDMRTELHAPIKYNDSKKAYYYPNNVDEIFPRIDLQEEEIVALKFYADTLVHYKNIGIFKDFTSAIDKVVDAVRIQSSQRKVSDKIIIQPENFPKFEGSELIPEIISGFDSKKKFNFNHQKHTSYTINNYTVTPILLKEYDHLWYLVSHINDTKQIRTFALDRITNFKVTNEKRDNVDEFNHEKYFNHAFGIFVPENDVEEVILEFDAWRGKYLSSAPIHKSQELISENKNKIQFLFKITPHYEFHAKILSYGKHVKVISPKSLQDDIKRLLKETLQNY